MVSGFHVVSLSPSVYPQLLNDATKITEIWGEQGIMDPFEDLYEVQTLAIPHGNI